MRKTLFITTCLFLITSALFAQAPPGKGGTQINAGLGFSTWGVPVYVGADFGIHPAITIGPKLSYRNYNDNFLGGKYRQSLTVISFNGNYHFNELLNLTSQWNLYAGASLGYYIWSDVRWDGNPNNNFGGEATGIGLDLQVGGRYFFNDKWALNLELGGGTGSGGSFGVTYKLQK
ncbi:MAG: hypothetical protein R2820_12845 [Cyclobacteriaceae bacterium]|nr:outer membrane beta-barrel protein [Cyclobacteriaceae bacterium]